MVFQDRNHRLDDVGDRLVHLRNRVEEVVQVVHHVEVCVMGIISQRGVPPNQVFCRIGHNLLSIFLELVVSYLPDHRNLVEVVVGNQLLHGDSLHLRNVEEVVVDNRSLQHHALDNQLLVVDRQGLRHMDHHRHRLVVS